MNTKVKVISIFAASLIAMSAISFSSFAAENDVVVEGKEMYNDYIKLLVDDDGAFRLQTTKGDPDNPNDDYKKLIYGSSSSTSHTTLNVDSETNYFDNISDFGECKFNPDQKNFTAAGSYKGIDVRQDVTFVPSNATGREDLAEIKYTVTNNSDADHEVGIRIMIDTMLGDNDDAPFRIPNVGSVFDEMTFTGDDIPEYFQAFDDIDNPAVVSNGFFDKTSSNKADKVQFIGWWTIDERDWNIDTTDGKEIGDSAVTSIWNPKALQPGETRVYKMYYGLGTFEADTTGELHLAGYGQNTSDVNETNDGYMPSVVTAYVKNSSENTLTNVQVKLNTVDGMTIAGGEQIVNIGELAAGEEKQVSWTVNFAPSAVDKAVDYSITSSADNAEEKTVNITTNLPAVTVVEPSTAEPTTAEPTTAEPTTAEPTTAEPTTVEPTTVEPTTAEPTTVATSAATSAATNDTATNDTANGTSDNGTVKTGSASFAALLLTSLTAAAGFAFLIKKREKD